VNRNLGATYFIPSEDEWYKAAFYKGGGTTAGYWDFPMQSNSASNVLSSSGTHNANFSNGSGYPAGFTDPTNLLTPVGAFSASPGPYGTFDMGGDVDQWNEGLPSLSNRGARGGAYNLVWNAPLSKGRGYAPPSSEYFAIGFRVASVPEPGSISLLVAGALGLLAYGWRRRRLNNAASGTVLGL
jgi:formylglycine-generating enzyme required for sulfatase activity